MKTKLLLLHFLLPLFALAQFTQIGADIDGEAAEDRSGRNSLSSDGSTLAIGAYWNDGNGSLSGHVRIYQNTGGAWIQVGADIDGEAADDRSGRSVSLSADGSIVAIGAPQNDGNGSNSGHVRVYQYSGGAWTQIGADIDGEAAEDASGWSVSLSDDGSIVAIGARLNDGINGSNSGHVRIYQNNGGTWIQIGADIDGEAAEDASGFSVSLNSDGTIVAIGSRLNDGINGSNSGHVRIYQNTGGTWTQIAADIDGEAAEDASGSSVSLSADGSIVAIGAPLNDENGTDSGHVRVYQNTGGTWTQIGEDIDGETADDVSGQSVSLSYDGSIVAIGAPQNDGNGNYSGHVRIYQNIEGTWTQIGADIDGEASSDASGHSISSSADGSIVAIGAYGNNGNGPDSGHVRVFDLGIQQTLEASFASNTTNTCIQEIIEFYDQSAGVVISWDWTFESGSPATSTSQNPMVVYFTPGIYDVTLTVGDGVEYSTITFEAYMTVGSVPDTPETPGGDDEVCTNFILTSEYVTTEVMYADSYEWEILPAEAGTIDGTGITGTVTWTTNWEGTATIKVKGINETCGESEPSDAFEVECSNCTGIGEYGELIGIQVYPNPSNGQFTVKFDKNIGQTQIIVMNMLNEILYDQSIETMKANAVSFDLSNHAEGVYFVRIKTDSTEQIRKIIVQ